MLQVDTRTTHAGRGDTFQSTEDPQTTRADKGLTLAWPANWLRYREGFGKGAGMGVASGKTGSCYSLGHNSPGQPAQLPINMWATPDQGASGKLRCATSSTLAGCHYFSGPSQKRWNHDCHSTATLGIAEKPATLPCSEETQA